MVSTDILRGDLYRFLVVFKEVDFLIEQEETMASESKSISCYSRAMS
jgi:hypothetical protein